MVSPSRPASPTTAMSAPARYSVEELSRDAKRLPRWDEKNAFIFERIRENPTLLIDIVAVNNETSSHINFFGYMGGPPPNRFADIQKVISSYSADQRDALATAACANPKLESCWKEALLDVNQATFDQFSPALEAQNHIAAIKQYAKDPAAALRVIGTMRPPEKLPGVRRLAKAFAAPFAADPSSLRSAMLAGGGSWRDVLVALEGDSATIFDVPNTPTTTSLNDLRKRVAENPLHGVSIVRSGNLVHQDKHHAAVREILCTAASSSADVRAAMIAAALARSQAEEHPLAAAAITSALADHNVDRALWPKAQDVAADHGLLGLAESLVRTPDLLSHLTTPIRIRTIENGGHELQSADQARRMLTLITGGVDRGHARRYLALALSAYPGKWSDTMLLGEGLAQTPSEHAALAITKVNHLAPEQSHRHHLQALRLDPELQSVVVSQLATRLATGDVAAGQWLTAIVDDTPKSAS